MAEAKGINTNKGVRKVLTIILYSRSDFEWKRIPMLAIRGQEPGICDCVDLSITLQQKASDFTSFRLSKG